MTSIVETPEGKTAVAFNDVAKGLKTLNQNLNQINTKLKDRNLKKDAKAQLEQARQQGLKDMLDLTVAGIQAGEIDKDVYGVLRADVCTKAFKGWAGHANKILKAYIDSKNESQADKKLSDIELAKLMTTPIKQVDPDSVKPFDPARFNENGVAEITKEEIPTVTGEVIVAVRSNSKDETIIVDKQSRIAYIQNQAGCFAKLLARTGTAWYEISKALAVNLFGLIWNVVVKTAMTIIKAILKGVDLVAGTAIKGSTLVMSTGFTLVGDAVSESKKFWSKVRQANAKALDKFYQQA